MASDTSNIVAEYQSELDGVYGDGAWTVVDYATEFEALWDGTHEHGIVMFWDGMPAGLNAAPVDIESNLTPYDWVLSFSRNLAQRGIETNFRVVIFDMTSDDIPTAFGVRMSSVLEANFPWLSICRSFENLHKSIDQSCLRPVSVNDREIIDLFAQIWINNLARSQDHHDINNLIAPQVLLEAMGRAVDAHLGRSTLMLHVRRLGLIETSSTEVDIEKWLARPRESISELEGSLRFVLIDDQVDHGWAEVIAKFVGMEELDPAPRSDPYSIKRWSKEGKAELWTCSSAAPLIDRLWADLRIDEQADDMRHPKDLRFQLAFTGDEDGQDRGEAEHRQEVLLLDLRLGRSGGIDRTSLRRIAEIALVIDRRSSSNRDYVALVPNGGDWPQLGWLDAQWEEWLDTACSPETALHPMALGLLASVIAAIDLAYPIIIFSSTGQREIIEGFRGSPTILTDFEKPRILGSGSSEWLFNATLQWRDAVLQADDILHVRHVVQRAIRASLGTRRQAGTEMIRHVTIALDETGDFVENQGSAIGGVVIETTGETQLEAKIEAAKFMEHLRQNGVNFYDHVPAYAEIGAIGSMVEGLPIDKGCIIAGELQAALAEFSRCSIGAFRCVIEDFEYTNSNFSGGSYLKWLEATLEVLLAEYLPSLGWQNQRTSLSIWLPQRSARGEAVEAQRLDFNQHDGLITTLGGRSVAYSLVARALEDRACIEEVFSSISSLKIRKIPYYKDVRKNRYNDGYDSATDWYCVHCKEVSGFSKGSDKRIGEDVAQLPLTEFHRFCQKHRYLGEFMAADFSVAAHLADAAISMASLPGNQLGRDNIRTELSFDIQAGERVADFLQVGRLFDRGFPDDAFRLAFRNEFFVAGLNRSDSKSAGAKVESRLVTKIARHVGRIDAAMVVELAGLPRTRFR